MSNLRTIHTRDMDGLVICAVDRQWSLSRVRILVPPHVQGPVGNAPTTAPFNIQHNIGTAGGWVACLVIIFCIMSVIYYLLSIMYQKHTTPHLQQRAPQLAPPADSWRISSSYSSSACGFETATPSRLAVALPL